MARRLHAGSVIPEFRYDTPYRPQQSFYELLEGEKPVFFVFLRNFGHPIARNYIMRYIETAEELRSARLACVVRTRPHVIANAIPEGAMPYQLICDAEGVLYRFFAVPEESSKLKSYSLEALKILKAAKRQGFSSAKNEPQQLPLTLLVAPKGRVLFAHYGSSLTDLPADCEAMQRVAAELLPGIRPDWLAAAALRPRAPAAAEAVEVAVELPGAEPAAAAQGGSPQDLPAAGGETDFFAVFEPADAAGETQFYAPPEAGDFDEPQAGLGQAPAGEEEVWEALLDLPEEPEAPQRPAAPGEDPLAALPEGRKPGGKGVDLAALGFGPGN